ncbi:MAG: hypothetical protein Q8922_11385 [Bacteroidota bacterium]|nr:hypothetical protein [Bacteroidota bacterium]
MDWIVRLTTLLFAAALAYEPLYHLFRGSLAFSVFPQDDFYYYYLTAKNIALHGFSSFDGIVPTNGYHPLWLWVLSAVSFVVRSNDRSFFIALEGIQIISAMVSAELLMRLLSRLFTPSSWLYVVSLGAAVLETVLIFTGMETVLAIPLLLLFAWMVMNAMEQMDRRSLLLAGFIGSLLVLARLDTVIAVGLALVLLFQSRVLPRYLAWFVFGLVPVVLYLLSDFVFYGDLIPVSAQVKQLPGGFRFSFRAIEAIGTPRGSLYFLTTIIGFVLALWAWKKPNARSGVRLLLVAFPILFTLLLALRVTWSSYLWYFYPFPISTAVALLLLREQWTKWTRWTEWSGIAALGLIIIFSALFLVRDIPMMTTNFRLPPQHPYLHALGIQPFTESHPGRYAMGDRAGITAFMTHQPMLQLEGLAADEAMVDSIRGRADLLSVLRRYGVQYYIVSYPLREFHESAMLWDLVEPHEQQIQPYVPRMRGRFYAPDVFRYPGYPAPAEASTSDSAVWITRILDISHAIEYTPMEGK